MAVRMGLFRCRTEVFRLVEKGKEGRCCMITAVGGCVRSFVDGMIFNSD